MESSSDMEDIIVEPLGAGQDVGRSCVIVKIRDKTIIFDVGIHMVYTDIKRFPDFKYMCNGRDINEVVDLVVVTHFHLDHCGALPVLSQNFGYKGPIYASTPTKAMIPFMLEDYRKVMLDMKYESGYTYTTEGINNTVSKISSVGLCETVNVNGIKLTSYYAGHVLGACMFHVEYQGLSVVYTGDYNMNADRHLGGAHMPKLRPHVIITQTTYATTIRDTKRDRERNMLKYITETVENGGKVLIPVFALGRAQQLCVLLETYWNRTQNNVPIYFSAGLIEKANFYYKLFVDWENEKIKQSFLTSSLFDFKKIQPFDKNLIKANTPMVLFATPGMLHGGTSMQVFKEWCTSQKNTLIIPGYCVAGTLGNKLLSGMRSLNIDKKQYEVSMRIENISFSAHADAKGIINLLRYVEAENVVLVHGEKNKMKVFAEVAKSQLQTNIYWPANHEACKIPVKKPLAQIACPISGEQGSGYVVKLDQRYKFILEHELMEQANQMLPLLGIQDKESLLCYGQIDFSLNLALPANLGVEEVRQKLAQVESAQVKENVEKVKLIVEDGQAKIRGQYWRVINVYQNLVGLLSRL